MFVLEAFVCFWMLSVPIEPASFQFRNAEVGIGEMVLAEA